MEECRVVDIIAKENKSLVSSCNMKQEWWREECI
jgi:hypothetical protein